LSRAAAALHGSKDHGSTADFPVSAAALPPGPTTDRLRASPPFEAWLLRRLAIAGPLPRVVEQYCAS